MRRLVPLLAVIAVLVLTFGAGLAPLAPPATADLAIRYVALGDSFASVGTLTKLRTDPIGCARSIDNYPSGVAARLSVEEFVDMTCGAATTVHMTQSQTVPLGGVNRPQFSALTPETDLVTLTIGGNDIGFGEIVLTCGKLSVSDPTGAPCQRQYGTTLPGRIATAASTVDDVLDGIRARAPRATIVVVGYLRILPPATGCWPMIPVAAGDVPYLGDVQRRLNTMLGERARAHDATFVNPGETTGHDVCQLPTVKWVEGIIPTSLSIPVHPNAAGQSHVASLVAAELS
jgi:lysophospholipase L1-like esterase